MAAGEGLATAAAAEVSLVEATGGATTVEIWVAAEPWVVAVRAAWVAAGKVGP